MRAKFTTAFIISSFYLLGQQRVFCARKLVFNFQNSPASSSHFSLYTYSDILRGLQYCSDPLIRGTLLSTFLYFKVGVLIYVSEIKLNN
jgi:hypothetical protein